MINNFAFVLIILHVVTAQVIPYDVNKIGPGNIGFQGTGIYQSNTVPGLPVNNIINYNGPPNINERIYYENNAKSNSASSLIGLAGNTLSNVNGNTATFDLGGDGKSFTITSGSPGPQGFGFQVQADALEVGGTVSVNGQIPIYGTVSVSGNVPADGTAAVNYNCGKSGAGTTV